MAPDRPLAIDVPVLPMPLLFTDCWWHIAGSDGAPHKQMGSETGKTPLSLGFTWPAEWEGQKQAFLGFPSRGDWFRLNAGADLSGALQCSAALMQTLRAILMSLCPVQDQSRSRLRVLLRRSPSSSLSQSALNQTWCVSGVQLGMQRPPITGAGLLSRACAAGGKGALDAARAHQSAGAPA